MLQTEDVRFTCQIDILMLTLRSYGDLYTY